MMDTEVKKPQPARRIHGSLCIDHASMHLKAGEPVTSGFFMTRPPGWQAQSGSISAEMCMHRQEIPVQRRKAPGSMIFLTLDSVQTSRAQGAGKYW